MSHEYGTPAYQEAALVSAVAGAKTGMSVHVFRLQPGNGSSYDLSYVRRSGGGWCVVWDAARFAAIVRRGNAWQASGQAELSVFALAQYAVVLTLFDYLLTLLEFRMPQRKWKVAKRQHVKVADTETQQTGRWQKGEEITDAVKHRSDLK